MERLHIKKTWLALGLAGIVALALEGCGASDSVLQNKISTISSSSSDSTNAVSPSQLETKFHFPQVNPDAMMKVYSMEGAKQIGKTNPEDDAKTKDLIFAQRIPGLNIQTAVLNMEKTWDQRLLPNLKIIYTIIADRLEIVTKEYNCTTL